MCWIVEIYAHWNVCIFEICCSFFASYTIVHNSCLVCCVFFPSSVGPVKLIAKNVGIVVNNLPFARWISKKTVWNALFFFACSKTSSKDEITPKYPAVACRCAFGKRNHDNNKLCNLATNNQTIVPSIKNRLNQMKYREKRRWKKAVVTSIVATLISPLIALIENWAMKCIKRTSNNTMNWHEDDSWINYLGMFEYDDANTFLWLIDSLDWK